MSKQESLRSELYAIFEEAAKDHLCSLLNGEAQREERYDGQGRATGTLIIKTAASRGIALSLGRQLFGQGSVPMLDDAGIERIADDVGSKRALERLKDNVIK